MAEPDLSKIVNLIMENPNLIAEIKNLGASEKSSEEASASTEVKEKNEESVSAEGPQPDTQSTAQTRRRELLNALKPYVSETRSKAIETMMSVSDILDMMRTK